MADQIIKNSTEGLASNPDFNPEITPHTESSAETQHITESTEVESKSESDLETTEDAEHLSADNTVKAEEVLTPEQILATPPSEALAEAAQSDDAELKIMLTDDNKLDDTKTAHDLLNSLIG